MFLKRLDIIGFKSFADKTAIEFSPGITAVVGPNGSGKSNISDAIRWVLGEQSARSLRGSKMEDVIFAGSETRRSINFCEVSLTLDNTDRYLPVVYDEVNITRRVYRSGESEYRLNKQACRLKDITELFMDSGLGRESYSIIGQGRIEEMLSTRPEDRRGPFEDAAGIVKFKFRKREATRRLEETANNILRVDDIVSELERQAGPLEQQAERAKTYKKLHGELTSLDISLLVHDIEQLKIRWKQTAEDIAEWKRRREEAAKHLAELEHSASVSRQELDFNLQAAESLQQQLMASVELRQKNQGQLELLTERRKNSRQSLEERRRQRAELSSELNEIENQIKSEKRRLQELTASLEIKTAELELAANEVNPDARTALEQEINQLNAELIEMHQEAANARNTMKQAEQSAGDEERRRRRVVEDLQQRAQETDTLHAKVEGLIREQEEKSDEMNALIGQWQAAKDRSEEVTGEESETASKLGRLQSQLAALRSRAELLQDLESGYDGYAFGVRSVLQAADKGRLNGIHGSLASLLRVEKRYETAIETALGGALQNIVVDDEESARVAIQMLKQRQAGRATFMPLTVIKGRFLNNGDYNKVSHHQGFLDMGSGLVQTDSAYRSVIEHLLGNVIVAQTLQSANEIARLVNYRVRIVTLDGDVVNPGGTMSGGTHSRKGPGLLGRNRERSQVEHELEEGGKERSELEQKQQQLRNELVQLKARQRELEEQIGTYRDAMGDIQIRLQEMKTREHHSQELYDALVLEQQQMDEGQNVWRDKIEQAAVRLKSIETELESIEQRLSERRAQLEARDKRLAAVQENMTAMRVEVATLTQERDSVHQRIQDAFQRRRRLLERSGELKNEESSLEVLLTETENEIVRLEEQSTELSYGVGGIEDSIAQAKMQRKEAEEKLRTADERVREQQQTVHTTEEQVHRAEVQAERADVELGHALQRMGDQFKMTYEWAKDNYPALENVETVRSHAEGLRRNINQLGEVQLGAIEEWDRLSERLTFLRSERSDLETARMQLTQLIGEMDEEMSQRFAATFEQIRTEFQVAFRQLFSGGKADLQLTDADDLLNAGIEVIAQPPGKKLQNLNLMSGGERALTAMALLFAILKIKPVPFVVLDEVEAALDEANVGRFAQYLRSFSDDSQFIVVTHRRGTMEEADVLYGVAMQESGVSSLIAVKLSELEPDTETA
ncbi:chromosome segregation protein SMC [Alicyclobacillus sp. SO9]|uniref:chromosome segregation protein SMC n=1 Tax=Alicyclobacillus sp. SO9 TaxID=2665646 RepID=UPI0018E7CE6A|nr:chromosome segregation protein SMC [Alicyclobacillus sp. SO9]QQE80765.1 chromosome segregation protein SMC [Alicyclobacillus sp. SO9]